MVTPGNEMWDDGQGEKASVDRSISAAQLVTWMPWLSGESTQAGDSGSG